MRMAVAIIHARTAGGAQQMVGVTIVSVQVAGLGKIARLISASISQEGRQTTTVANRQGLDPPVQDFSVSCPSRMNLNFQPQSVPRFE